MKKTRIVLLYGGVSSEHEVSVKSAASILKNINIDKYTVHKVYIAKDGVWYLIKDGLGVDELSLCELKTYKKVVISPYYKENALICPDDENTKIEFDLIWPVLHGKNGEDGSIQGLCRMSGTRCVGSGICSSAVCMDKALTKRIIDTTEIQQADYMVIEECDYRRNNKDYHKSIMSIMCDDAVFVKPANSGSSVGISRISDVTELRNAMEIAFKEDSKIIIEEEIHGRELEVAVLGNEEPIVSCVGEIMQGEHWYDYESKYNSKVSKNIIPASINKKQSEYIRNAALKIYKTLGCQTLARVDFFLADDGRVIFNEINTMPGFTESSMYPKLFEVAGITFTELIDKIIDLACEKQD